jgi:hypothetical protein
VRSKLFAIYIFLFCSAAFAGPYADELKQCFVKSSSSKDNITLIKWMAKAMVAHPALADFPAIKSTDKSSIDKEFAAYVQKILVEDCKKQTVATFENEGMGALEGSLELLAQFVLKELMSQKEVASEISAFTSHIDQGKLIAALMSIR